MKAKEKTAFLDARCDFRAGRLVIFQEGKDFFLAGQI